MGWFINKSRLRRQSILSSGSVKLTSFPGLWPRTLKKEEKNKQLRNGMQETHSPTSTTLHHTCKHSNWNVEDAYKRNQADAGWSFQRFWSLGSASLRLIWHFYVLNHSSNILPSVSDRFLPYLKSFSMMVSTGSATPFPSSAMMLLFGLSLVVIQKDHPSTQPCCKKSRQRRCAVFRSTKPCTHSKMTFFYVQLVSNGLKSANQCVRMVHPSAVQEFAHHTIFKAVDSIEYYLGVQALQYRERRTAQVERNRRRIMF